MKKILSIFTVVLLFGITLQSCKKNVIDEEKIITNISTDKHFYLPTTKEELKEVELIKVTKELIKKVYKDKEALKEVNAFIAAKVFADETVFLKDLLNPNTSKAYEAKQFQKFLPKIKKGIFAQRFQEALGEYNNKNTASRGLIQYYYDLFATSEITIYFPYSKNFVNNAADVDKLKPEDISLCAADRDADSEIGDEPEVVNFVLLYKDALINDAYVDQFPTHIIGRNHQNTTILILDDPNQIPSDGTGGSTGGGNNYSKKNDYTLPGRRVFLGWTRCTSQYDALISFTGNGGGSELKYCRIDGYLQVANGYVNTFQDQISMNISRSDISHGFWQQSMSIWDPNWVTGNEEQVYAIWEEDTKGSITFSGSLATTVVSGGTTVTGNVGFSVTRQSQDAIIRQLKWKRDDYLNPALLDQGCGFLWDYSFGENWPVYDCGATVSWTFPFMTF